MNLQKIFLKCSSNASNLSGNLFYLEGGGVVFPVFCALTHKTHVFSLWVFWKQQPYMNINILVLGSLALVDLLCRTFSQLKTPLPFHILWSMPCNGLETKRNIKTHYVTKYFTTKSCFYERRIALWYFVISMKSKLYITISQSYVHKTVKFSNGNIPCTLCTTTYFMLYSDWRTMFLAFSSYLGFRMDKWR